MSTYEREIAIVGFAARVPGADDADTFWRNLCAGTESIELLDEEAMRSRGVPEHKLRERGYRPVGASARELDAFDAEFFGLTRREAEICDPQFRLFLELSYTALEHAGYDPWAMPGRVAVLGGSALGTYGQEHVLRNRSVRRAVGESSILIGTSPDYIAPLVSYKLGYTGPSVSVYTACSTSLVAVHLGVQSLRARQADVVVAGGVQVDLPLGGGYVYREGGINSADGHVRPFDAGASGTVFADGGATVVLKRLRDALADGDTIHGVLLGSAVNNDGDRRAGFTAPGVAGQAELIEAALADARIGPRTIGMMEAHGTGTVVGDPIEVAALTSVYRRYTGDRGFCRLGSVKGNVGHLGAGSGAVSLIKALYALKTGLIPPSINCDVVNPALKLAEGPFVLASEPATWDAGHAVRRAAVSSFGIGGTNAHVILERAAQRPAEPKPPVWRLVPVSARTPQALEQAAGRLAHALEGDSLELPHVTYTLQEGRPRFARRRAVVARTRTEAASALRAGPDSPFAASGEAGPGDPRVALLFPGQGAQTPGMGRGLYRAYPVYRDTVDECAGLLAPTLGLDLRELLLADPGDAQAAARLRETAITQPSIFVTQYAAARLWESLGARPAALLGHSVGEFTAACLAGVFALPDALRAVARRGALMQATGRGTMLALPLDADAVRPMLPGDVEVAAANSPAACVVAGSGEAIARFAEDLADLGITGTPLRTSHAFHSRLMEPVLEEFATALADMDLRAPEAPFVSGLTGEWITPGQATSPAYWAAQLRGEVRFDAGVRTLRLAGHGHFLEAGPGRALTGFVRRHLLDAGARGVPVAGMPGGGDDEADLFKAAARLWTTGVELDWERLERSRVRRRVALPSYPFQRDRHWIEPDPDPDSGTNDAAEPDTARHGLYVPAWRQELRPAPRPVTGEHWLLVGGPRDVADAVAEAAAEAGATVTIAESGQGTPLDLDSPADVQRCLQRLTADSARIHRIVHLDGLDAGAHDLDQRAVARRVYRRMAAVAQALVRHCPSGAEVIGVTARVWSVNGEPAAPAAVTALGPLLTLPREQPSVTVRQIDVAATVSVPRLASALVAEVRAEDAPDRVALRGPRRWVQSFTPLPEPSVPVGPPPLRQGGVYVITGGLGGLGLAVGEELARAAGARLVLVGRTAVPDRERWPALLDGPGTDAGTRRRIAGVRRVEAAGGQVLTVAADVGDRDQVIEVLRLAEKEFGEVNGIVHAAGVPGGQLLAVHDESAADAVFAAKLDGASVLAELAEEGRLPAADFVALFSSIVTISADYGHCDYMAANLYLDALAAAHADGEPRFVSINWWGWRDVGMVSETGGSEAFQRFSRARQAASRAPVGHPLVDAMTRDDDDAKEFEVLLRPEAHWVWAEHRIDDAGSLPGTGLLEMVAACARHAWGKATVRIADVLFIDPVFVSAETIGRISFAPGAEPDTWDFAIAFRSDGEAGDAGDAGERVQCRGTVYLGVADSPAAIDLAACRAGLTERGTAPEDGVVRFGPNFQVVTGYWSDGERGLVELSLPADPPADTADLIVHPALLDRASYGVPSPEGHIYLPFSYRAVEVRAPLPRHCWAVQTYHSDPARPEFIEADITIVDDAGNACVIVAGYSCRSVTAPAASAPRRVSAAPGAGSMLATVEGQALFLRILATWPAQQVVTTIGPLSARIERSRAFDQAAIAAGSAAGTRTGDAARPEGVAFAPPGTAVETALVKLWSDALGLREIGIDDDFFDLGGESLTVVYLASSIRERLGVEITVADLFERTTIRDLALLVEGSAPGTGDGR
ncbi:hypothetical protein C1I98_21250 [Spongiactinospora gelatinilytica]|uniref:Uncharacterized protein n=1 Tax=Spongiactinospora gelatinilytica TaxID=2666298 RepID=A0A2W2H5H3_9ACTN|nr:type I polyketide synthase [Spongiactinospora gelatinilytica]PZG41437.1 hypothetical protein C1I98_21250 [Spongiactinospora gelatinilytica]